MVFTPRKYPLNKNKKHKLLRGSLLPFFLIKQKYKSFISLINFIYLTKY